MHARVEHFAQQLDHFRSNAAEAECQNVRAQHHHCAHFRLGERLADAAGVAANEI